MRVSVFSILGALVGLAAAFAVHRLTCRLRFRYPALTTGLGILGAVLFTVFSVQLLSPYLGIPLVFPILFVVISLAIILLLVIFQSRSLEMPWWRVAAAQFVNVLVLFFLVLLSVWLRDALVSRLYPVYGEVAFQVIHAAQNWLAVALVLGPVLLEFYRGLQPGRMSPGEAE
jgi:hypothetical protein